MNENNFSDNLNLIEDVSSDVTQSWKILIVDDDADVHLATDNALSGVDLLGRIPHFLHAYSAAECIQILAKEPNVAVILLDVVMETEDAGLLLVSKIRKDLGLTLPRIILRTGQPGYAPELEAIRNFDINDYKTKSELTRNKLFITVLSAVRAYKQLKQIDAHRQGLEQIVKASGELLKQSGLNSFSSGIVRQLAALIGVEAEGLLCAHGKLDEATGGNDYLVLAASGRYETLIGRPLEEIDDPRIVKGLIECLENQTHIFEKDYLILHFRMQSIRSFAVFVDSSTMPEEVDRSLLEVFCANVSICAENIILIKNLNDFAYFDHLVELPNRTAFVQAINEIYGKGDIEDFCVVLADIDQFAEINNAFGHEYGDQLLSSMASRLRNHFAQDCFIARLAGDAFGILGREAEINTSRLRDIFSEPFSINGMEHSVGASTGIVRLSDSGPAGQIVLKDASIARKLARAKGINNDVRYSPFLGVQAKERTHMLQQLHGAFDHNRLFPVYQPQINIVDGSLMGFEVLMRWRNEYGTLISPVSFIPIAEQSGLIVSMGTWILRSALFTLSELKAEGWRDLRMAVNVSAIQFQMPNFIETLRRALEDTGIEPHMLEIEITESVAMMGQTILELSQIKQMGIEVAIDDFGTGFSSLSYLERLPLNRIKIDRSFIQSMDREGNGKHIAELVIQLGKNLGLKVIAEGVEHAFQAYILKELGCSEAQGFFYGMPMEINELKHWLNSRRANH
ncbi:MAG: EAL domain-containing protein [Methylophilaceae bacterium]